MSISKSEPMERTSQLMQQAFSLIEEKKFKEAKKIGKELKRLRHSSAFEILALVYLRQEKMPEAVAVLEEGTSKAGRVWLLWELLGNCYSDLGRFRDAENAYQRALQQESCDPSVVHLNRAIAFERNGRIDDANAAMRQVKSSELEARANAVRIRLALAGGKIRTAQRIALKIARSGRNPEGMYDKENKSAIMLSCALAFRETPEGRKRALRFAYRAVDFSPANTEALALIRELRGSKSRLPRLHRLLIHGDWSSPLTASELPLSFYRSIQVVAPTDATAFEYVNKFFPTSVRKTLKIEEHTSTNTSDLVLDGVYYLSGYAFYEKGSET
jgi:Flp pilus assembly protein TadD